MTPAKWNAEYQDFNAPLENGTTAAPSGKPELPPAPTVTADAEATIAGAQVNQEAAPEAAPQPSAEGADSKKRKRHEGETAEERAERKRKKKEKKEKRKSKKGESDESE